MADVWRGEVNIAEVSLALPNPTPPPAASIDQAQARYAFACRDGTYTFSITVIARWHTYAGGTLYEYRTEVECRVSSGGTDFLQTDTSTDGAGTAAYEAGSVLAIEKDQAADEIRFITPLGTVTATPSTWGGNNNVQMKPDELSIFLNLENISPPSEDHENLIRWNHFWGSQNGVRYMGAAMSDDQPGSFSPWSRTIGGAAPFMDNSFVQEAINFKAAVSVTAGGTYNSSQEQWDSSWTGGTAIPFRTLPAVEMARSDEHSFIWAAYATSAYPEELIWLRSSDGLNWTQGVIDNTEGQVVRNPSLYYYGGRLVANWTNGSHIMQSVSHSLGEHWDGPTRIIPLVVFADNPRLRVVCDRRNGTVYLIAIDFVGDLVLYRSYDRGDSFEATGVDISIGVDDAIVDATITQDSRVHVRYQVTGAYETATSSNWGTDWRLEDTAVGLGTNPRSTEDPKSGWTFHVNWIDMDNVLFGYGDPEFGLRAANFGTFGDTVLAEQVADIEMRPDGVPIVAYFESDEVFSVKRSFDYANTWED